MSNEPGHLAVVSMPNQGYASGSPNLMSSNRLIFGFVATAFLFVFKSASGDGRSPSNISTAILADLPKYKPAPGTAPIDQGRTDAVPLERVIVEGSKLPRFSEQTLQTNKGMALFL